jgi:hypothetical protein
MPHYLVTKEPVVRRAVTIFQDEAELGDNVIKGNWSWKQE